MSINRIVCRAFRKVINFFNMSSSEIITKNNQQNERILNSLQEEFAALQRELIARKKVQLRQENADLRNRVTQALSELVRLETENGKKQIPIPGAKPLCIQATDASTKVCAPAVTKVEESKSNPKEKKPKKEKPVKVVNNVASPNTPTAAELPIDVGRLDLRVGKIVEVCRHPDADSLYLEKIDCGEAQPRTVVSGLVKYVPLEEMQNRSVVVLCNLKPAKMRGITSEAMVMCASTPDKVEVLSPPEGSLPGDLVHCEGFNRNPDAQLNPKKKIFETCAPDLKTNDNLVACFKGAALHVPGKGNIVTQTLRNANVK